MSKKFHEKQEWKEYENQLSPDEKAWIKKFYGEYYNGDSPSILKSRAAKREAIRNSNGHLKDPLMVGHLYEIGGLENNKAYQQARLKQMQEVEKEVASIYKKRGPAAAFGVIMSKVAKELGIDSPNKKQERAILVALQSIDWVRKQYRRENR